MPALPPSRDIDEILVDRTLRSGTLRCASARRSRSALRGAGRRSKPALPAPGLARLRWPPDLRRLPARRLAGDARHLPHRALLLRLGVVTPLALILLAVLWFQPPVWLRELIAAAAIPLAGATTLGLMLLSHSPYREGQHHAIILVILFATIVQRVRFPYAVAGCLAGLLMHAVPLPCSPCSEYPHAALGPPANHDRWPAPRSCWRSSPPTRSSATRASPISPRCGGRGCATTAPLQVSSWSMP